MCVIKCSNSTIATISVLYAKFLVVMGLAFPMTEVISTHVTSASYLVSSVISLPSGLLLFWVFNMF